MIETRVKMSAKFLKLNEVYEFIETLERQHKTKFVKQKCTKELEEINDFDNFKSRCDSKSIQWTSRKSSKDFQMEFDGKPFLITGKRLLECRFGPLRCSNENSKKVDHTYSDSKHTSIQTTRKLQCPAKIVVRQIVKFKDFTITRDSEWLRRAALIRLKAALVDDSYSFDVEIFYIVCYPSTEEHQNHYSGPMAESSLDVDDRVMTKMKELFDQGVKKVGEMRRRIRDYVESNLFQGKENPPQSDSRFWPSKKSIHNCWYRCQVKARLADDDLQNLIKNIPQWQKDGDNYFVDTTSIYVPLDATFLTLCCCKNRQLMHLLENMEEMSSDSTEEFGMRWTSPYLLASFISYLWFIPWIFWMPTNLFIHPV